MLTINDIASMDNWKGTESCGDIGQLILGIARRNGFNSKYDVESVFDENDNFITGKYILKGVPHASQKERSFMELVYKELGSMLAWNYFPGIWNDEDFREFDRRQAEKELANAREKIKEYYNFERNPGEPGSLERYQKFHGLIKCNRFLGFITEIRGISVGISPMGDYKCAVNLPSRFGGYSVDEVVLPGGKVVEKAILPQGSYQVFRLLEFSGHTGNDIIVRKEIWCTSDDEFFNVIDGFRGKAA